MSKYTTEVRFICETAAGLRESEGLSSVKQILTAAVPKVFDFDFPIFDESYRNVLETKILRHYYTREIGLETVGLWKLKLETKLNEIMPYYNQLYKSELLEFNPFYDVDLTRDHKLTREETATQKGTVNTTEDSNTNESTTQDTTSDSTINNTTGSTSEENATGTKTHYDKYSDTPQGSLQNVQNDTYLTNARMINDNDTQTGKTTVNGTDESKGNTTSNTNAETSSETRRDVDVNSTNNRDLNTLDDYLEHVKGKNGGASYSALLKEFRETFLNIDMMIIDELAELFFNLW
nr:MAG TPA: Lower collar protein [Caudoviricetes sp.]